MNNMSSAWLFSLFRFLQLVQEKFPDVTVSPGWMVRMACDTFSLVVHTKLMIENSPVVQSVTDVQGSKYVDKT